MSWGNDLGLVERPKRSDLPEEWRLGMTLCIAAIAHRDKRIILATDGMLSTSYTSIDTGIFKGMPLTMKHQYFMAFAGSPHHAQKIALEVVSLLRRKQETLRNVMAACERAFQTELRAKIEATILSPLGLDLPGFIKRGRMQLGAEQFARLLYEIRGVRLETDLLVVGFDASGARAPRLFAVSDPGEAISHEALGFHAVGSGAWSALGSLYATYSSSETWIDLAYRICEAKFLGESAPGVGKNTAMMMKQQSGKMDFMPRVPIEEVRGLWEEFGRPRVPDAARPMIQAGFQIAVKGPGSDKA